MTTNREAISRLRNLIKAVNDDAFITDRYIHSLLIKHSKAILHRKDVEDKLTQGANEFGMPSIETYNGKVIISMPIPNGGRF